MYFNLVEIVGELDFDIFLRPSNSLEIEVSSLWVNILNVISVLVDGSVKSNEFWPLENFDSSIGFGSIKDKST